MSFRPPTPVFVRCLLLAGTALVLPLTLPAAAAERAADFPAALQQARERGEDLAVLFHGSDWCVPGRKFATYWQQEAFARNAGAKLVILEIDRQENPTAAAQEVAKRNDACPVKPRSLPALALFDREGRLVWLGEGAPDLEALGRPEQAIRKAVELREKRDEAWQRAVTATGPDKARWLARGLDLLALGLGPKEIYKPVLQEMQQADPGDQSGEIARFIFPGRKLLESTLEQAQAGRFEEADRELAGWLAKPRLSPGQKQEALAARFALYQRWPEKKGSLTAVLKELEKLDPKSELGQAANTYQQMLAKKGG